MEHRAALEFAARTDTGRVRSHNEDSIAINPDLGVAILADGMGGYNAGEVASSIATVVLKEELEAGLVGLRGRMESRLQCGRQVRQLLADSVQRANNAIFDAARANPEYSGMGTTLVAALLHRDKITIAHVGDSRAYRFRRGELVQLTRDHSLLQEQIDAGLISAKQALLAQHKNFLTRAVGVSPNVDSEIHDHVVEPEDLYLLCSDGLSDMLSIDNIRDILASEQGSLNTASEALVRCANDNGGSDNISVILMRRQDRDPNSGGLFGWIHRLVRR